MLIYIEQFNQLFTSMEFIIYVWVVITDVITGNIKSIVKREWNSNTGLSGLLKHFSVTTFAILVLSSFTIYYDTPLYQNSVIMFLTGINLISVIENLNAIGVKFPDKITQFFTQMKTGGK